MKSMRNEQTTTTQTRNSNEETEKWNHQTSAEQTNNSNEIEARKDQKKVAQKHNSCDEAKRRNNQRKVAQTHNLNERIETEYDQRRVTQTHNSNERLETENHHKKAAQTHNPDGKIESKNEREKVERTHNSNEETGKRNDQRDRTHAHNSNEKKDTRNDQKNVTKTHNSNEEAGKENGKRNISETRSSAEENEKRNEEKVSRNDKIKLIQANNSNDEDETRNGRTKVTKMQSSNDEIEPVTNQIKVQQTHDSSGKTEKRNDPRYLLQTHKSSGEEEPRTDQRKVMQTHHPTQEIETRNNQTKVTQKHTSNEEKWMRSDYEKLAQEHNPNEDQIEMSNHHQRKVTETHNPEIETRNERRKVIIPTHNPDYEEIDTRPNERRKLMTQAGNSQEEIEFTSKDASRDHNNSAPQIHSENNSPKQLPLPPGQISLGEHLKTTSFCSISPSPSFASDRPSSPMSKSPWASQVLLSTTSNNENNNSDSYSYTGLMGSLVREEGHIYSLAASGDLLYTGSDSKNIRVWKNKKEFSSFKSNSGLVKTIIIAGEKIFTGHQDGKIRLWKVSSKNPSVHKRIGSLPSNKSVFKSSMNPNSYVEITRNRNATWLRHFDAISCLSLSEDQTLLYSSSWDKTFKVWRLSNSKCLESVNAHDDAVNSVVAGFDGLVFTGSADGTVKVWRREMQAKGTKHFFSQTLLKQECAVTALSVDPSALFLYCGSSDGIVNYWERAKLLAHGGLLRGHKLAVLCLATAGSLVFSGSADTNICVWRREGSEHTCLSVLCGHTGPVKCLAVEDDRECGGGSGSGRGGAGYKQWIVYSGSLDKSVKIWRVSEKMVQMQTHKQPEALSSPPKEVPSVQNFCEWG